MTTHANQVRLYILYHGYTCILSVSHMAKNPLLTLPRRRGRTRPLWIGSAHGATSSASGLVYVVSDALPLSLCVRGPHLQLQHCRMTSRHRPMGQSVPSVWFLSNRSPLVSHLSALVCRSGSGWTSDIITCPTSSSMDFYKDFMTFGQDFVSCL